MGYQYPVDDAELMQRLISAYKLDAIDCLSLMEAALAKDDVVTITKASCALNRAASVLSADVVCAVSNEIETAARDGRVDKLPAMVQRLRDESAKLVEGLSVRSGRRT